VAGVGDCGALSLGSGRCARLEAAKLAPRQSASRQPSIFVRSVIRFTSPVQLNHQPKRVAAVPSTVQS
jgi:hypothetical protein